MNKTRYKIIISTVGVSLEEIPEILEQVKDAFTKGYVTGLVSNDVDIRNVAIKNYNFKTTEW